MKNHSSNNSHYKQILIIATLLLTSCSPPENTSSSENLGKSDAGFMSAEVHVAYLNCYPLNELEKNACLKGLALKYISAKQKTDSKYIRAFQYETEKLGFKRFLNSHNLPCEEVSGGPIFDANANAYTVTCKPAKQYLMKFDYIAKKWEMVEG